MVHIVRFPNRVGLGEIEDLIAREHRATRKASRIKFDLRQVGWIGHFPATLLYSWCVGLKDDPARSIEVLLPNREMLSAQIAKALLRFGVLKQLQEIGVDVPYLAASSNAEGLPLTTIESSDSLTGSITDGQERLREIAAIAPHEETIIEEAFSTVLFELGENAFLYGKGSRPHYQVSVATSSGSDSSEDSKRGVVSVFPAGTRYVEVVLGDTGPGIDHILGPFVPGGYSPVVAGLRALSKAERTVAFAFEFSSSSNRAARAKRVEELLSREDLDPQLIATGLYCVASLARRVRGQVIIRTPGALMSLDFSDSARPVMLTRRQLLARGAKVQDKRPLPLPGTHYWLRLPLVIPIYPESGSPQRTLGLNVQNVVACTSIPWSGTSSAENEADTIEAAIANIDEQVNGGRRIRPDIVCLLPPLRLLSSRATGVLVAALHQLALTSIIIWPDEAAGALARAAAKPDGSSGVLFGDPSGNTYSLGYYREAGEQSERVSLPPYTAQVVAAKYHEAIETALNNHLRSPSVRFTDGAFFLGKYYTDVFYYAAATHAIYRFPELVASWTMFQILTRQEPLPEVILATAPALSVFAVELAARIEQWTDHNCVAICPSRTVNSAWVIGSLLPYQGKRLVVLADIICTGETLESILSAGAEHEQVTVVTLVDAREASRIGRPLFVPALGRPITVIAVSHESITPHERPTGSFPIAETTEHRIYVVDPTSRTPTLYAEPLRAAVSAEELIGTVLSRSEALLSGHIEHEQRHYTHFWHLHRLFSFLKPDIEVWVKRQINAFLKTQGGGDWRAYYLDPDASLPWVPECLRSLEHPPRSIERVTSPAPETPQAIASAGKGPGRVVLLIPAMETGYSTRQLIEFTALSGATSVLALVLFSRMDPHECAFLSRVSTYRESVGLRVYVFIDFGLFGSQLLHGECEVCMAQRQYSTLAALSRSKVGQAALLTRALLAKADSMRPVPAIRMLADERYTPSPTDIARLQLQLYYKLQNHSAKSGETRRSFKDVSGYPYSEDTLLLQLISSDQPSPNAGVHPLLLADPERWARVEVSAAEYLEGANPPQQLARVIPALCQLLRADFLEACPSLLLRFAHSLRDVEEILCALLVMGEWPPALDRVARTLADDPEAREASLLIADAKAAFDELRKTWPFDSEARFVEFCTDLHAALARSSALAGALDELGSQLESGEWKELRAALDYLIREWTVFGNDLILPLASSDRWDRLTSGTTAAESIMAMRIAMAELQRCRSSSPEREGNEALIARTRVARLSFLRAAKEIVTFLSSMFASPVHLSICEMPDGDFVTYGRVPCRYSCRVDRRVGLAFMHVRALNSVCSCVLDNWKKLGQSITEPNDVEFRLYERERRVILEFRDNFAGDFPRRSLGGLRTIEGYCRDFAAELEFVPRDFEGFKALRVILTLLPNELRR